MLHMGYLIILDGQSIKKSVSEISIFELLRRENCIMLRLYPRTSSRWHHERNPRVSQFLNSPPSPRTTTNPPIHMWGIPSSKAEQVSTPGSITCIPPQP